METTYFTSMTVNYWAKARVLCKTLKKYNPSRKFVLALSEDIPKELDLKKEPFDRIITIDDLVEIDNKEGFKFKHTITELCTAVKPFIAKFLMKEYKSNVIYLDPDIAVFDELNELESFFDKGSILLTPHQLVPEKEDIYIRENEILFLKRGTYNFGFFGVKNDDTGRKFLDWWSARLKNYCFDDNYEILPELSKDGLLGLFTDQKWADLIPSYFERYYIIREPGYNVCTWNLSGRTVKKQSNGTFYVNDKPLFFFHFSGYDSGGHAGELNKSLIYYPENKDVKMLSEWYGDILIENEQKKFEKIPFPKMYYSNGDKINNFERKIYHIRKDVYKYFPNPYEVTEGFCFYNWVREEYKQYFEKKDAGNGKMRLRDKLFPKGTFRRKIARKIYRMIVGY